MAVLWHERHFIAIFFALLLADPTHAEVDSRYVAEHLTAANQAINQGRVKEGVESITNLFRQLDPAKDSIAYWNVGAFIVEYLSQTESHALAEPIFQSLLASKLAETDTALFQWMQLYLGRHFAYTGQANEAEPFLRALTGGSARLVHTPPQRAAAIILSTIELDRNNVDQAAVWMRRAVIGTLVDKGAGSEEIVDVLTSFATFLTRTHRLPESYDLFLKLVPIYDSQFSSRSPKYLRFLSRFLDALTIIGNFPAADAIFKVLRDNASAVDIVATSVRADLFFQELYQLVREQLSSGQASAVDRLKEISLKYPDFSNQPRIRIIYCYFAELLGEIDLAEQFLSGITPDTPLDAQPRKHSCEKS